MERVEVIAELAEAVTSLKLGHPTRVGVDGWSCSGKTTVADELAAAIQATGRQSLRASFDDFHPQGHRNRSMRGTWTPQLYYAEGYDYETFRLWLLEPLGPRKNRHGSRRCRTEMHDAFNDVPLPEVWREVQDDGVVVVDGIFLLHPELAEHWDYLIWIDADVETVVERAIQRDASWVGSAAAVEQRYRGFRQPVHELYERLASPRVRADAIMDNRDFERPRLVRVSRREG